MGRVAVVTDASTCLPSPLAEALGVTVLPISEGDNAALEASDDESNLRLPESVEHAELTAANHPFVTAYLEAIEADAVDAAVLVTPAVEFAAMFRNAALAAELADRPAVAVDSRTAAAGQALVVLAGAEVAAVGGDLAAVQRAIDRAARRVELVASLATLEPIRRSGPVPEEVLAASATDGLRSVFRMRAGTVEPLGGARSVDDALLAIRDAYLEGAEHGVDRTAVFHAGVPELAARLVGLIGAVDFVTGFSVAMQVHTGRGVVGAAWIGRAPES
ncbi:MAG: DegV family protein [Actinomycetota bacterium]|nr:DegV family protein [Actinomycetota bacterium]